MTPEEKDYIDSLSFKDLLRGWRFTPSDGFSFEGEKGRYWSKRMQELREQDPEGAVRASKELGW